MSKISTHVSWVVGIDLGFRKTGMAVLGLSGTKLTLVSVDVIESKPNKFRLPVAVKDQLTCRSLAERLHDKLSLLVGDLFIVVELPFGGAQSGRAMRCMGMATGIIGCFDYFVVANATWRIRFHYLLPTQVESALGVKLAKSQAKLLNLTKHQATSWKKSRIEEVVVRSFPEFSGWPKLMRTRSDAYDAVAVVLAAKELGVLCTG